MVPSNVKPLIDEALKTENFDAIEFIPNKDPD